MRRGCRASHQPRRRCQPDRRRVDETGIASRTWDSYPILKFSEAPEITSRFVGAVEDPPLGVGEAALGPVTAAIGNAVTHALGARIRDLPFSSERRLSVLLSDAKQQ